MPSIERSTVLSILWDVGVEGHAVEKNVDEKSVRKSGSDARILAKKYFGEFSETTWCKFKHAGLAYINAKEQISKRIRREEDYSELKDFIDSKAQQVNNYANEMMQYKGEEQDLDTHSLEE